MRSILNALKLDNNTVLLLAFKRPMTARWFHWKLLVYRDGWMDGVDRLEKKKRLKSVCPLLQSVSPTYIAHRECPALRVIQWAFFAHRFHSRILKTRTVKAAWPRRTWRRLWIPVSRIKNDSGTSGRVELNAAVYPEVVNKRNRIIVMIACAVCNNRYAENVCDPAHRKISF